MVKLVCGSRRRPSAFRRDWRSATPAASRWTTDIGSSDHALPATSCLDCTWSRRWIFSAFARLLMNSPSRFVSLPLANGLGLRLACGQRRPQKDSPIPGVRLPTPARYHCGSNRRSISFGLVSDPEKRDLLLSPFLLQPFRVQWPNESELVMLNDLARFAALVPSRSSDRVSVTNARPSSTRHYLVKPVLLQLQSPGCAACGDLAPAAS
jgi:hypothetical protein